MEVEDLAVKKSQIRKLVGLDVKLGMNGELGDGGMVCLRSLGDS